MLNLGSHAAKARWLVLARILLMALFIVSGCEKIGDTQGFAAFAALHGVPFASVIVWPTIAFELLGAAAIIVGYRTRMVAIAYAIYVLILGPWFHQFWHFDWATQPLMAQLMLDDFFHHTTMAGGFIMLAVFGPGPLSVDSRHHYESTNS